MVAVVSARLPAFDEAIGWQPVSTTVMQALRDNSLFYFSVFALRLFFLSVGLPCWRLDFNALHAWLNLAVHSFGHFSFSYETFLPTFIISS
jgi:hypothetical protein